VKIHIPITLSMQALLGDETSSNKKRISASKLVGKSYFCQCRIWTPKPSKKQS